ncbi:MAG TPA: efflux RND transporter periplasmic adaptor subunit [Anaerolineaceae bacterium]|nr:efflux RND transporter periplasmic adaptor subunit [Anaerolineaceae bacterium]
MKRWLIAVLIIVSLGLVAGIGYLGYQSAQPPAATPIAEPPTVQVTRCTVDQTISAPGSVVNTLEAGVLMPADGELAEILVRPGQPVQVGEILVRLANPEKYAAATAAARLELLEAQTALDEVLARAPASAAEAHLALLDAQAKLEEAKRNRVSASSARASQQMIDAARASLVLAKDSLTQMENYYQEFTHLSEDDPARASAFTALVGARQEYARREAALNALLKPVTEEEISRSEVEIALAQARYDVALAAWNQWQAGVDSLEIQKAQARLDGAQARLTLAEAVQAAVEIKAPFSGVITDVSAKRGVQIPAGSSLLTLIDPQQVEVEGSVVEEDLPLVEVGQPVNLFFDALPDEEVTGRIVSIIPKRVSGESPRYLVRIALDRVPEKLMAGMTADSSIIITQRPDVLCLPRAVVRANGDGNAQLEVWNGMAKEKRVVTVGLRGDSYVEILSGLQLGEKVVTK